MTPKGAAPIELLDIEHGCRSIAPRIIDAYKNEFPGIDEIQAVPGREPGPLKVCIATEDIVGPIRNGGIGTTYTHLSFLLADAGHDVTIIYPRGKHSEINTIEYWVDWYRERGVRFVPLDLPNIDTTAGRWLRPMTALYDALKDEHFDLVHVSEWRGLAYLCLLAKEQGIHFQDTLFCVKSSSPYLWNREFMLEPITDPAQLAKMYAERRSIELADMVIGGSRHLLIWMMKHGYKLPEGRTYVQPNVAVFAEIDPALRESRPKSGARVPIDEIVFFGRLEGRKGLEIFCDALHRAQMQGVKLPKVTFLGKYGARIASHPELTIPQYIEAEASKWGVEWQVIDNYQQAEAITYLLGEGRLAVMPSVIENSSLTVYEATHFAIPFVASDCGGNPELVASKHCDAVLMPPHPVPLSEKLHEALDDGGFVAAPSYDNENNLRIWRDFHRNVETVIKAAVDSTNGEVAEANVNKNTADLIAKLRPPAKASPVKISACLVLRDNEVTLQKTLDAFTPDHAAICEVIIVNDGSEEPKTLEWLSSQRATMEKRGWRIIDQPFFGTPHARNFAASEASGDYILFIDAGATLKPDAIDLLARAASYSQAGVLVPFHQKTDEHGNIDPKRVVSIKGDPCFPFFRPDFTTPLLMVSRPAFGQLGGFTTDYKMAGDVAEFLANATLAGLSVQTVPEALSIRGPADGPTDRLNETGAFMRAIRPYTSATPLCLQPLLLSASTFEGQPGRSQNKNMRRPNQRNPTLFGIGLTLMGQGKHAAIYRLSQARDALAGPEPNLGVRVRNAWRAAFRPPQKKLEGQLRIAMTPRGYQSRTGFISQIRHFFAALARRIR